MIAMTDPEPTEVSDLVAAAAASPTEMAGAVETDTESAFAWGLTEPILDDESHRPRSWLVTGAAVAASLAVVAAVDARRLRRVRWAPAFWPSGSASVRQRRR